MEAVATELSAVFRALVAEAAVSSQKSFDLGHSSKHSGRRITEALAADLVTAGVDPAGLQIEQQAPGSERYQLFARRWDLVLVSRGIPAAVVEWKTLGTFMNFSNRLNELVAAAVGLRTPFAQAGAVGYGPQLAILFIVDPIRTKAARPDYLERFAERLRSLISDRLVDCACILRFDSDSQSLADFSEDLGFGQFAASIVSSASTPRGERADRVDLSVEVGRLFSHGNANGFASGFASTEAGQAAVEATIIENRRKKIRELQDLAVAEGTTELQVQAAIGSSYWIFGGQYVGLAPRDLVKLDQHDFALICADGSLHVIELKRPDVKLAERQLSHYIVTGDVHRAVSQCLNYLRSLDEQGAGMQTTWHNERGLDFDFRRAKGTVVIGHLDNGNAEGAARFQVQQAIRSYNAHLSRIQVITYSDLLDSADRALRFESNPGKP